MAFVEPAKGPNISSIIPTSTTLKITWKVLSSDDSNGDIRKYEICYQRGLSVSSCDMKNTETDAKEMTELTGLKPATIYTVAVRAFTDAGGGPLGVGLSNRTLESGKLLFIALIYSVNLHT